MAASNDIPQKHWLVFAGVVVLVLVVGGILTMEPGPDEEGYREDGSLAWAIWKDPETGTIDRKVEYDADEHPRRELRDKNGNGRFEVIREFRDGACVATRISSRDDDLLDLLREPLGDDLTRETRDANGDGIPETITVLRKGVRVSEERDTNRDGRTDMWVEFEDGRMVRIKTDSDGDGKPDRMRGFP